MQSISECVHVWITVAKTSFSEGRQQRYQTRLVSRRKKTEILIVLVEIRGMSEFGDECFLSRVRIQLRFVPDGEARFFWLSLDRRVALAPI